MGISLSPVAISVQQVKPSYAYGQMGTQLVTGTAFMLARVGIPAALTPDVVITSAQLVVMQRYAVTGSVALSAHRLTAGFTTSTKWSNRPGTVAAASATVTKTAPAGGTMWTLDVTADMQAFVTGAAKNFGWRLSSSKADFRLAGAAASANKPVLLVEYVEPGQAPEDLYPNGLAVSVAKPGVSFLTSQDTTAVQVQLDADAAEPADFDTGAIASTEGYVDLAATAYSGLAEGASTFWRARSQGAMGWTPWSTWATFSRRAKPVVTITSPLATTDDSSPPVAWSSPGTVTSWRVLAFDAAGKVLADSGPQSSTDRTWTPPTILRTEGSSARIEVRVTDGVLRGSTPGDPAYALASVDTTLSASSGVTPPVSMLAAADGRRPSVSVSATSATVPDGWAVIRDGVRVFYDPAMPTTTFAWTDWTAQPNTHHAYRVARVVNGQVSGGGTSMTVETRCTGVWLADPETGECAALFDQEEGSWSAAELAIVHQPIMGPPVRRVSYRPPMSGALSGLLVDSAATETTLDGSRAALLAFKNSDASRVLRLVLADTNIPVSVGEIMVRPLPVTNDRQRVCAAEFAWWQVGEVEWGG